MPGRLEWLLGAFWDLSPSRHIGMAPGGIPFEATDRYAVRYGITDFDAFHTLIRAMDRVYLEKRIPAK